MLLLNLGYGLMEGAGGFLAGSQSLKADALDFVGDGSITLLAVIAIGWSGVWRARVALLQGLPGTSRTWRVGEHDLPVFVAAVPEANMMAALPWARSPSTFYPPSSCCGTDEGDANVRAVWLFSRKDAIGNAGVIVAAGLVWLSGSSWPDLFVAVVIAGLFLQSAWKIVGAARRELDETSGSESGT